MLKKGLSILIIILFIITSNTIPNFANSAEPPSLVIIVENPPEDFKMTLLSESGTNDGRRYDYVGEVHYTFYYRDLNENRPTAVEITAYGKTQVVDLPELIKRYHEVHTLDLDTLIFSPGESMTRSIKIVSFRVFGTLLIEGFLFFLYGFRNRRSWIGFITLNLITQAALNISLINVPMYSGYPLFYLIYFEFFVFVAELIAIHFFVREKTAGKRNAFVLVANTLSIVIAYQISYWFPLS